MKTALKNRIRFNKNYFFISLGLLIVEIMIASFAHDDLLPPHSITRMLMGDYFIWTDIAVYTLGILTVILIERLLFFLPEFFILHEEGSDDGHRKIQLLINIFIVWKK